MMVWHPIEEKMPPYGKRILLTIMYGWHESTRIVGLGWRDRTDATGEWFQIGAEAPKVHDPGSDGFHVIAWMELPPPSLPGISPDCPF